MITKKNLIKKLRLIAKKEKVNCSFTKKISGGSYADNINLIEVTNRYNPNITAKIFFHELVHALCFKNNIFTSYHIKYIPVDKKERIKLIDKHKKIALRAERWVDKKGQKMMREMFPYFKNVKSFYSDTKKAKKYLSEYYDTTYENIIRA